MTNYVPHPCATSYGGGCLPKDMQALARTVLPSPALLQNLQFADKPMQAMRSSGMHYVAISRGAQG